MHQLSVLLLLTAKVAAANADEGEKDFAALKEELVGQYDRENGYTMSNFTAYLGHPINESIVQQSLNVVANFEDIQRSRRLAELSASMRPLFVALPKDADGMLSYQTSRYAVHRYMMQERGWYIRGLESSSADAVDTNGIDAEWVAAYLHGQILQRSHSLGTRLSDLALFVAAFEELIFFDSKQRLRAIYEYLGFAAAEPQTKSDVQCILDAFMFYMLSFDNLAQQAGKDPFTLPGDMSPAQRRAEVCVESMVEEISTQQQFKIWRKAMMDAVGDHSDDKLSFSHVTVFVDKFLVEYHTIQQLDCRDLKNILVSAEKNSSGIHMAGRLDLASYHKLDEFGDFKFKESKENLQRAGVLDESGETPYLVLSNYIGSRINCVESSGLFAICCQNECDAVLSQLELHLESPVAPASDVVAVLKELSFGSSLARPEISSQLFDRLAFLAKAHHGVVPIHSEGFAMWMHHLYPSECPQAHPQRSSTFPMTAGEWIHEEGESWVDESSSQASGAAAYSCVFSVKSVTLLATALLLLVLRYKLETPRFQSLHGKLSNNSIKVARRCCLFFAALSLFAAVNDSLPLGQLVAMFAAAWAVRYLLYRIRIGAATDAKVAFCPFEKLQKAP
eukprot:TRINITY_DN5015_c0_g2_i5.p1 TRINITY_DN5015_c0_g2~~TRINITY_DN5015_c0_g2_i5.p1  ORF type:complete len:619 (+),score=98.69 TRINITY_DN5015_c0_g2_i5:113-1969(+)